MILERMTHIIKMRPMNIKSAMDFENNKQNPDFAKVKSGLLLYSKKC